ncbi:MAG TPA: tRNA (guanosine(37)-N1)-methyltransferase TrmD [Gemmatimonadaceae bacterium]|nr:tRNA (guanosine(37)-N1)-methyltransferase TrmD [Gemmatimonadaceae bacterium]
MLAVNVVTIFPDFFNGPLALSIPARAAAAGVVRYNVVDLRDFTRDRHRTVDDAPYGGGAGMVMKPEPFFEAVEALGAKPPIVLVSARGRQFTHADAVRFSAGSELTILCGHYKDVDQRVADHLASEEISLGDFVLSGGEPAALAIIDATVRLIPGAMSDLDSARTDSFFDQGLSAPSYTRPPVYRGHAVPEVLLSGDHARIALWREEQGKTLTATRHLPVIRPASPVDLSSVEALLTRCSLPLTGLRDQFPRGYSVGIADDGEIIGAAGVERYASDGLLRSVAVDERYRGRGIADRLLSAALRFAAHSGASAVYLLTETAAPYFANRGFNRIERGDLPAAVAASPEAAHACGASATVMVRHL